MKKKVIFIVLIIVISVLIFIPFLQQKTISVKKSFFDTYQQLARADNWTKWRSDLKTVSPTDSDNVSTQESNGFKIHYNNINLLVKVEAYTFSIRENNADYNYTIVPGKTPDSTSIVVTEKTNFINYISNLITKRSFSDTHIDDLKDFIENPDLYYGYKIIKIKPTDTNMIVLRTTVLTKNKFAAVAKMLTTLQQYANLNGLKQTQPPISEFLSKGNDSVQLKIGVPVDKKLSPKKPVIFMEMPGGGSLYTINFRGKFIDRLKAYSALQRYFKDRNLSAPILPFETYLDNKLPTSDSDIVNIRINFAGF